ncbi:TrbL/VirB6 family protein [Anaplasma phagocytophilum]|uniref:type IV secretion system protein n=1 Tax=Anaplasma phagocytophilum TaxID=948 RepID=UPI0007E1B165|nr:type IV secretion system protein [Anaplasma phagocytophilum]SBO31892.1 TrbL/VirB6 plasmid conjugal transfer protein [Anaplasma phagocytophilum]SBO32075.1 TrbL/VirB6 plasmid conjugal transfer protein [Anaplasma phagocytophilum]SBO32371.1 TrbL/VirB6 plasmid conjugal transfer protein [Anaplasma phagocytophilum]
MLFRLLLFIAIVVLSSCGGTCIEPGAGVSSSSQEVQVPVYPDGADHKRPVTYWVHSGHRVGEKDEIKITVDRTIDLCPLDTKAKPAVIRMYPEHLSTSREPSTEFYDTHIDVQKGDQLRFSSVLYDLNFPNCKEISSEHSPVIYHNNEVIFQDSSCKKAVEIEELCLSGATSEVLGDGSNEKGLLYVKDANGKCNKLPASVQIPRVGGSIIQTPRMQYPLGYIGVVDSSVSGELSFSYNNVITNGRIHDARVPKMNASPKLDQESCELLKGSNLTLRVSNIDSVDQLKDRGAYNKHKRSYTDGDSKPFTTGKRFKQQLETDEQKKQREKEEKIAALLSEYTEYDLNCHCGYICKPSNQVDDDCIRSIVTVMDGNVVCPTQTKFNGKDHEEDASQNHNNIPDIRKMSQKDFASSVASLAGQNVLPKDSTIGVKTAYELAEGVIAVIVSVENGKKIPQSDIAKYCDEHKEKCKYLPDGIKSLKVGPSGFTFEKGSLKLDSDYIAPGSGRLYLAYWPSLGELGKKVQERKESKAAVVVASGGSSQRGSTVSSTKKYYEDSLLSALAQRRFFWKQDMSFASGGFLPSNDAGNAYVSLSHDEGATTISYSTVAAAAASGSAGKTVSQSSMSVARNSENTTVQGFYSLSVRRTCYATSGQRLYMYIGDTPPTELPGKQTGAISLDFEEMNKSKEEKEWSYKINAGTENKRQGYIYFGVAVDPAYEANLKKTSNTENYYSVHLWVPKWKPIFSSFFNLLQGMLLHVLYGTDLPTMGQDTQAVEAAKAIGKVMSPEYIGVQGSGKKKTGAVQQIYNNQVLTKPFWSAVRALLVLYLMFSVLGYIIGVIQVTKYDVFVRVAKIALIVTLVSPGSWQFFTEHCFSIFILGIPDIISAFNGYLGGDTSFAFLDSTLGIMLTSEFWLRMLSLFMAGPVGWLAFIGVIWALFSFFLAMMRAIILYLFVMVGLAFLLTLAPIFITFLLFQITKGLFDGWLKMLVNFMLQPIILFAALAFLNQVIITSLHAVTDFAACEACAVGFNIPSKDSKAGPGQSDICIIPALLPTGFALDLPVSDRIREGLARGDIGFMGLPFSMAMLMVLILACKATREFGDIAEVMAHSISGSVSGVTSAAVGATQSMLSVVGLDDATQHLIKSAIAMDPVGTDKVRFDAEDSVQPRHDGIKGPVDGSSGADSLGKEGSDSVQGASDARRAGVGAHADVGPGASVDNDSSNVGRSGEDNISGGDSGGDIRRPGGRSSGGVRAEGSQLEDLLGDDLGIQDRVSAFREYRPGDGVGEDVDRVHGPATAGSGGEADVDARVSHFREYSPGGEGVVEVDDRVSSSTTAGGGISGDEAGVDARGDYVREHQPADVGVVEGADLGSGSATAGSGISSDEAGVDARGDHVREHQLEDGDTGAGVDNSDASADVSDDKVRGAVRDDLKDGKDDK